MVQYSVKNHISVLGGHPYCWLVWQCFGETQILHQQSNNWLVLTFTVLYHGAVKNPMFSLVSANQWECILKLESWVSLLNSWKMGWWNGGSEIVDILMTEIETETKGSLRIKNVFLRIISEMSIVSVVHTHWKFKTRTFIKTSLLKSRLQLVYTHNSKIHQSKCMEFSITPT